MSTHDLVILGGGLAGLAAATTHGGDYLLLERESRCGGLARTQMIDGYALDYTGHWLHFRNDRIRSWIEDLLGDDLLHISRKAACYTHQTFTHYPFQANTYGLPPQVAYECLLGFMKARDDRRDHPREPEHFKDWIHYHYGEGIAKHFMIPYNQKLWGLPLEEITSAWTDRFVPKPNLEAVLAGALGLSKEQLGYNAGFRYPKQGGIEPIVHAIVDQLPAQRLHLNETVQAIDTRAKTLTTNHGTYQWRTGLFSSLPLPHLVAMIKEVPDAVRQAAAQLRYTTVSFVHYGLRGEAPLPYHWVYCPDKDLPFYRVGCSSNVVRSTAPDDRYLLYVERSGSDPIPLNYVRRGLKELGWLLDEDQIEMERESQIHCAYVVFDKHYESACATIFEFLQQRGITPIGRFGRWTYGGMEDALWDGISAVEAL